MYDKKEFVWAKNWKNLELALQIIIFITIQSWNLCNMDIEINAWSPLFVNLQINLFFIWYPGIRARLLKSQFKSLGTKQGYH